jgi:hypothetical protein
MGIRRAESAERLRRGIISALKKISCQENSNFKTTYNNKCL